MLNSHRKFFISYSAPVAWNAMMIVSLLGFGGRLDQSALTKVLAWGSVAGSALQLGVQLPMVLASHRSLQRGARARDGERPDRDPQLSRRCSSAGASCRSAPTSIRCWQASCRPAPSPPSSTRKPCTPCRSAFSACPSRPRNCPPLSSAFGETHEVNAYLRNRLNAALRQIAFFVVPSAMAFLALGDIVAGAIYQTGKFGRQDSVYVWAILAGSAVGLLATTLGRLYASAYYALRDTRTPLRFAVLRVVLTAGLGYVAALHLPQFLGFHPKWGVVGLTASAGLAGWLEFALLRNTLNARIGATGIPLSFIFKLWIAAAIGAAVAWGLKLMIERRRPIPCAIVCLGSYGAAYFAVTAALGAPEAGGVVKRVAAFARGRSPAA